MSAIQGKTIQGWQLPFRSGADVTRSFVSNVDKLLALVADSEPEVAPQIEELIFAKKKHAEWVGSPGLTTNRFLIPAVQSAGFIGESLLKEGRAQDAFWTCNVFGEMCKILVERMPDEFQLLFEDMIRVACFAVSDSWRADRSHDADESGEIGRLGGLLDSIICRGALGYSYQGGVFKRVGQPDVALGERLINEALARHFDKQLRHLLQSDRTRVREYARKNMPEIYRVKLADVEFAARKRREWEGLLKDAGFEEDVNFLRDMGDLVSVDELGEVSSERREDIIQAGARDDLKRVTELLEESAKELKNYLYSEAHRLLQYREPKFPVISDPSARNNFKRVQHLVKQEDQEKMQQALKIAKSVLERDIDNLQLRNWVAFLEAKVGNTAAAEQKLTQLRRRRGEKHSFATDWNLAVLYYIRGRVDDAYNIVVPLLDEGSLDEDLVLVVLTLSLELDDKEKFLATVSRTMTARYHPLALSVAYQLGDIQRAAQVLAQLIGHWQSNWELPPRTQRFANYEDLKQVVDQAIVEDQVGLLIPWLEARIKLNKKAVDNYIELARVLEKEKEDEDGAFQILRRRLEIVKQIDPPDQFLLNDACFDLLDLSKRARRTDIGQIAFRLALGVSAEERLLEKFSQFAPSENQEDETAEFREEHRPEERPISVPRDPQIAEKLVGITARLASIRNVASYLKQQQDIDAFCNILEERYPAESSVPVDIINTTSSIINSFSREQPLSDSRRVLYVRATQQEKRLAELLTGGTMTTPLEDAVTHYGRALKQVIGDLSRQAGVGPNLDAHFENPFISLESDRSTLVLRVTNTSDRPVTDTLIELLVEDPVVRVVGSRERTIAKMGQQESRLFNFPVEKSDSSGASGPPQNVTFGISLRASAEGFPNIDLGIKKQSLPVASFRERLGVDRIPKLFQIGKALTKSDAELFHGRNEVLEQIKDSFYGGVQRDRYFLDGIRRSGKTTILNFLGPYLPENVLPVYINLEDFRLHGPVNSAGVLSGFCTKIGLKAVEVHNVFLDMPTEEAFIAEPHHAFNKFLADVKVALPGYVPLLMIDEFQLLLEAIGRSGRESDQDTLVLDQLRARLEEGNLYTIMTGSVRFDRLATIVKHRIFGSLGRKRVSFLSKEGMSDVLRAGVAQWATLLPEALDRLYNLTGGYPWLAQIYGAGLVALLNGERRTVVTPEDVDYVTTTDVITSPELFEFWWPSEQLGSEEEHFIEYLFRSYPGNQAVSTREFFSNIHSREQQAFRRAFENLRDCEVFDSTKTEALKFSGLVLQQWLKQHMQEGKLRIRRRVKEQPVDMGQAGMFIDHENFVISLREIREQRGGQLPADESEWLSRVLRNLVTEAEKRVGKLSYKKTVAFWNRPHEALLLSAYFSNGFEPAQPEAVKTENAVDFKVADEVRRARESAMREGKSLGKAIIVTGDGDLSHAARALVNDGVAVQVWGGRRSTSRSYSDIVGPENVVALEDVVGL
jgi:tetratricopeptide (TPR) repeat protein